MAMHFVDLAKGQLFRARGLSSSKFAVFLELIETEFDQHYDAMKIIEILNKTCLPSRAYIRLKKMFEDGEPFVRILTKATGYCSYSSLLRAMCECGYSDLANKMKDYVGESVNFAAFDAGSDIVSKRDGSHKSALAFYLSLKRNIDNSTFLNKQEFLKMKTQQLSGEISRLHPESTRRRGCLLDKLIVVYCLSLENITDVQSRLECLDVIRKDESVRESQMYEAVLLSKEGATNALKGDFEKAEKLMDGARTILRHFKSSWATYYHYMSEVFLKVAELDRYPNKDIKESLKFYGFSGIMSVRNEDEETQRFLKRIYLSFMLYGLLGVNLFLGEVNIEITVEDRTLAKSLLSSFNRLSRGMETRRDMVYAFLMAKLLETEDIELALTYGRRAESLSKDGGVLRNGEADNISAFVLKLSNKLASLTDVINLHE